MWANTKKAWSEKISRLLLYFYLLNEKEKAGAVLAVVLVISAILGIVLYIWSSIKRGEIIT